MGVKKRITFLVLICVLVLAGCGNQRQDMAKENDNLKTEIQSLKQQVEVVDKKLKQQDKLYELRNMLDANLHSTLRALIKGDYELAKQSLASTIRFKDKKLLASTGQVDYEFIIPEKPMNLRQRTYMMNGGEYTAIYEIFDAGYVSGNKYDERIWTLNVSYVQVNGQWKISSLKIDE